MKKYQQDDTYLAILTKGLKKFMASEDKRGYSKHDQSVNYGRIRTRAIEGLENLAIIAEQLPEKWQNILFTQENALPLLSMMLDPGRELNEDEREQRRERLFPLCSQLIVLLNVSAIKYDPKAAKLLQNAAHIKKEEIGVKILQSYGMI